MAFSIEALQCKSKLINLRSREFVSKTFFPEMMPRDDEPIFTLAATLNWKNAVQSVLGRFKRAVARSGMENLPPRAAAESSGNPDFQRVGSSEDANEEGFVEVNLAAEEQSR